jgi:hypothetical protein
MGRKSRQKRERREGRREQREQQAGPVERFIQAVLSQPRESAPAGPVGQESELSDMPRLERYLRSALADAGREVPRRDKNTGELRGEP